MKLSPTHGLLLAGAWVFAVSVLDGRDAAAQEPSTLAGVVLNDYTGVAVPGARISLTKLDRETATDGSGRFQIDAVLSGTHEARFEAPGYATVVEDLTVEGVEFIQVRLTPLTAALDEILVLVGGRPQTRTLAATPVKNDGASWRSVLTLLEDQVPGVIVRRGGGLQAGLAITIRGVGSFQLSPRPDIYLDGVRLDTDASADALNILDLINADEVERVRVVKGASGGASVGGVAGAILIETRRGPGTPAGNGTD